VPVLVTVIGEGGSGGALAIAIGDVTLMLQYSTYSVISPEGCASILWKSAEHAAEAAETLGITAVRLKQLGLVDKVVNEPVGGAHRDHAAMMVTLKKALTEALRQLQEQTIDALAEAREDKILAYGRQGDSRRLTAPAAARAARRSPVDRACCPMARVAVALSGGRDSVALLDATLTDAAGANHAIVAFHVDHGLSTSAPAWARFCRELCAARDIPCFVQSVVVDRGPRVSVEAAARNARYAALAGLAREHAVAAVLLAHHADDQAETTLLQLPRGAGPRDSPRCRKRGSTRAVVAASVLQMPRAVIDDHVVLRALRHVDESNATIATAATRFATRSYVARNRARLSGHTVRAAELQADAAALLDDLAQLDARDAYDGASLDCALFASLDTRRSGNVLRWFLREQRLPAPSRARLGEAVRQLQRNGADSRIALRHGGAELGVHAGRLVVHRLEVAPYRHAWDGAEQWVMPHGTLTFASVRGAGIAARHVGATTLTIRSGVAGERLRLPGRDTRRNVADLLREAGVPRWDRRGIPRIYCDDALAAVASIGEDAAFAAAPGEPGFGWQWQPASALP
jgi:tRNA(Ile)-lysidine synthase